MQLRDYQQELHDEIVRAWGSGARVVMAQLPTGGGKTVTFSHLVHEETGGAAVVMAHRRELIVQMSVALAREGVRHRVFGPEKLAKLCVRKHLQKVGRNFIDPQAMTAVASVQTLAGLKEIPAFFNNVTLWVGDEGHHYLRENAFGRGAALFPRARGLLVTATPGRADGKGLGSHADGLADVLVRGPEPRELIMRGYLSEYKIFAPPSGLDREHIPVGSDGDFQKSALKEFTKKSRVLGDVVEHYVRQVNGKLGLTFADSIENAGDICARFRAAGVKAEMLSGLTPDDVRDNVLGKFERREVTQIVSVALIDEGFDCPAVEVVSDAAATESFNRFAQRFGRGLRIMEGKEFMYYFDHVGNTIRHGLPDAPRSWSLDRRDRRGTKVPNDVVPLRVCLGCTSPYERYRLQCPYCGYRAEPVGRARPEQVDGILCELDPAVLARMRGEVALLDGPYSPTPGLPAEAVGANRKRHWERQVAQGNLRRAMTTWGGWQTHQGRDQTEAEARFYFRFGVDIVSAWALPRAESEALRERIVQDLVTNGVILQ